MTPAFKNAFIITLTIAAVVVVSTFDPIAQDPLFHSFADKRTILGIQNFWNVVSNIPFILIGSYGLIVLLRSRSEKSISFIYALLFSGILLTGFGSAYYHFEPNNDSLVYDRIPMTIVFMSFLCATISERINKKAGVRLLIPLVLTGIASVLWWHYTEQQNAGDLRFYLVVQFYPVILIPLIFLLFPAPGSGKIVRTFIWIIAWYLVAKVLEHYDYPIFGLLTFISGHSLKHLAAAVSTLYILRIYHIKLNN
jgi:hypothetical protein